MDSGREVVVERPKSRVPELVSAYDRVALVLQGGGALGAYQAGVYHALSEAGCEPNWLSGVSIGAINASIIAGNKPEDRLARLPGGGEVDRSRVAQEAAVLADRVDVTEEIVRLSSHLPALAGALRQRGPTGKRIEFLLQEIHRELNTTGSKAGDMVIAELVLSAKAEVEKLREQVQNVE